MFRKTITVLSIILILLSSTIIAAGETTVSSNAPKIGASSAILVDAKTGQILYEKNSHEQRSMASTTKIMTGIITLERANLNEEVTVSNHASEVGESELFLQPGEKMRIKDLLYGLLLRSGNDVAVALAEHLGDSIEGFAELMNRKASSIGANNTHFTNPHGLYDPKHYSTAYDLALIARYGLNDKILAEIVATKEYEISRSSPKLLRKIKNYNKLLWEYPYSTGIKTGHIRQAGYCLVSSANKNGVELVAVVLNSPDSDTCFDDSRYLLEYGFDQFKIEKVIKQGKTYKRVKLPEIFNEKLEAVAARDLVVQVNKQPGSLKKFVVADNSVSVPVTKGQKLGVIKVTQLGYQIDQVDLVAGKTVNKPGWIKTFILWLKFIFRKASGRLFVINLAFDYNMTKEALTEVVSGVIIPALQA